MLRAHKVFCGLIALALVAALAVTYQRHTVERANNTVELVMDYEDIVDLALVAGVAPAAMLEQFRQAGITSLAVYDTTLEKLNKSGKVTARAGTELLHQHRTGGAVDPAVRQLIATGQFIPDAVYVTAGNAAAFAEVQADLIRRLGPERVSVLAQAANPTLVVRGGGEQIMKQNLGLSREEMELVSRAGFYVVPRPTNYVKVSPDDINAVFARMDGIPNVSTVIFTGEEVLGYQPLLPLTARNIRERGLVLGMIEHPLQLKFLKQEGLEQLARYVDYQAARVYVIAKEEQPKLKVKEAVLRWVMADRERNIRVNLMRPYTKPEPGKTLVETNIDYVRETKAALEARGFVPGRAEGYSPYFPARGALVFILLGVCAAGVLLVAQLFKLTERAQYLLLAGVFAPLALGLFWGGGTLVRQVAAMGGAVLFPSLAMAWQLMRWAREQPPVTLTALIVRTVAALAVTSLTACIGGIFVAALLGDVRFLLELEIYRGVKLTFVLPLLLVLLLYLRYFRLLDGAPGIPGQLRQILELPVKVKFLLAFAALAVVAIIYVGRSGHTLGVPVPAFELKMRAFLEEVTYARPREREFLIGHPAFFLAAFALYRGWPRVIHFGTVVFATMGQVSLVETFAHLRSPVMLSLVRGADGLLFGLVLGVLGLLGVALLLVAVRKLGGSIVFHE